MAQTKTDILIVGAGAAGLLCAGFAAGRGKRVVVLEKMNRPARKLMITGKGRCNLTNDCDRDQLLGAVRSGGRFLYSAVDAFSPQDTMALFEQLGVPLKVERGGRVFPVSDRAVDVVDALVRFAKQSGAELVAEAAVESLMLEDGAVTGVTTVDGTVWRAELTVLATGGKSYPLTGSDGDGYRLARQAGHTVSALQPSLIPIETNEAWCKRAMGLSLKNVVLRLVEGERGKPVFEQMGEMLFTHFGVSGPLVLSASAHMEKAPRDYRLEIDLKPALSAEKLDARLLREFEHRSNRDFGNCLRPLLPAKLVPIVVELSGIGAETKVHQVTKPQRQALIALLKALPLTVKGLRPIEEAVITRGGVALREVDPRTMQSKLVRGLAFAGEILDLDAYTGGYNLQIAFSTGYQAAMHT